MTRSITLPMRPVPEKDDSAFRELVLEGTLVQIRRAIDQALVTAVVLERMSYSAPFHVRVKNLGALHGYIVRGDAIVAAYDPNPEPRYCCAACKSIHVQVQMWVCANTGETVDDVSQDNDEDCTYCSTCEQHAGMEIIE